MAGDAERIAVGGGGIGHGLELDSDFATCMSHSCATFGNDPLGGDKFQFKCANVEAWHFGDEM